MSVIGMNDATWKMKRPRGRVGGADAVQRPARSSRPNSNMPKNPGAEGSATPNHDHALHEERRDPIANGEVHGTLMPSARSASQNATG